MAETNQKKLIKFGNSSYIITLPKNWIDKHKLKKGDLVYVSEAEDNSLSILPKPGIKRNEPKVIEIAVDDKQALEIQREITSAYINNYSEIHLTGKNVLSKKEAIMRMINERTGIDITEESPSKVVIKDIMDFESVSLERITRRMDNIIRSMFEDILIGLDTATFKELTLKELYKSDKAANKMHFLLYKVVRKCQEDRQVMQAIGADNKKLSDTYMFSMYSEFIGDEIKRVAKFLSKSNLSDKDRQLLRKIISMMEKTYASAMSAYYSSDKAASQKVTNDKDNFISSAEDFFEGSTNIYRGNLTEKIKGIASAIHNLAKITAY